MRRIIASVALIALLIGISAPAAHAGKSTDIALGLASFAVFNQVVGPWLGPRRADAGYHRREVVYETVVTQPRVVYEQPVVYAAPAPPSVYPTVVQYPHGRYELRGDGVTTAYQWVWVVAPSSIPPPPAGLPPAAPPTGPAQ